MPIEAVQEDFKAERTPGGGWAFWVPVAGNINSCTCRIANSVEELDNVIQKLQGLREIASPSDGPRPCCACGKQPQAVGLLCDQCADIRHGP